ARVMEIALADFGARVLYPARPPLREAHLYALYTREDDRLAEHSGLSYRDYMRTLDFLVLHRDYERNLRKYWETPALIAEGRNSSGEQFRFAAATLGSLLGTELHDAYVAGRVQKRFVRSLLFRPLGRPEAARVAYFRAVRKLKK
ncbi:MAG: hypothetical protein JO041_13540, partial [Acidobacteria bacterium]|nr:hypothetical protein [Acidobacteriota bacterium]